MGQLRGLKLWDRPSIQYDISDLHDLYGAELPLILESLMRTSKFQNDLDWIMPRLIGFDEKSREEVDFSLKKIIEARQKMGLGAQDSVVATVFADNVGGRNVYEAGMAATCRALDNPSAVRPSVHSTLGVPLSREGAKRVIGEFMNFCKKMDEISDECAAEADEVYLFNAGFFRVTNA